MFKYSAALDVSVCMAKDDMTLSVPATGLTCCPTICLQAVPGMAVVWAKW